MNNVSVGGSRSIISRILKSAGSEGEKARGFCYFYAKIARRQSQGKITRRSVIIGYSILHTFLSICKNLFAVIIQYCIP